VLERGKEAVDEVVVTVVVLVELQKKLVRDGVEGGGGEG